MLQHPKRQERVLDQGLEKSPDAHLADLFLHLLRAAEFNKRHATRFLGAGRTPVPRTAS